MRGSLEQEARKALGFLVQRYRAQLFFPYFQVYSSTFAPPERLREVYDAGLSAVRRAAAARGLGADAVRGLVISTRPDCLDARRADLIAEYAAEGLEVWVELGLQSAKEATLARIRRGHGLAEFLAARRLLAERGIRTAVHLILGLPGEDRSDMLETVEIVAGLGIEGVKFHDLYVPRGSTLAGEYLSGEVSLLGPASYVRILADAIECLPPATEVLRLCSDSLAVERLAPRLALDKNSLVVALEAELERRGSRQGSRYVRKG